MQCYEEKPVPGRGLGLVATRDIAAGEAVLTDYPLVLYPQFSLRYEVCLHCLRRLPSDGASSSSWASFCSSACAQAAARDPGSHNPAVAAAEAETRFEGLGEEEASALLLLLRVATLKAAAAAGDTGSTARLQALTSLSPGCPQPEDAAAALRARLPGDGAGLTLEEVRAVLERDGSNAYGIALEPGVADGPIRGSALCATGSRLNHECLPNLARQDAFDEARADGDPGSNTGITFRALHAIPAGEELTQSYFPLWWEYDERQSRCREVYGFSCACPRCKVEGALEAGQEPDPERCGGADEAYVQMYLLKFVCPQEECGGTLCPLSPDSASVAQCNICGHRRTDAQFMAELEA
ncbi:hypothetical protein ACKKBG_A27400 [Auxenochlorella protothecoides x Auxenochlorella symbiontica]|uniref:SET domain-containing protein n=2 Tax=Auxenochlorella protothecoides TaxID=3075 RepID=A0A3M7KSX4_AUXPR|nr:hypothetical protein APUTEX25_000999 [Auxenochlorella protothecoides]|eukprot:RMZ52880.1 hypothetical protein APUTEX25_000999 [Auxenochlorella protothecoides]